jgi:hypothetical protein
MTPRQARRYTERRYRAPTAEAHRAGNTVSYWAHIYSPPDVASDYEMILGGLAAAKADYLAARIRHGHAKAAEILQEIVDLTHLAAEFADGLAASRRRFLRSGRPWPLGIVGLR